MSYSRSRTCRKSNIFTLRCAALALLLAAGCSETSDIPDEFFEVEKGWNRDRVVELLGEPSRIELPPFDEEFNKKCEADAARKLVFYHDKSHSLFVFLDNGDEVLCSNHSLHYRSH